MWRSLISGVCLCLTGTAMYGQSAAVLAARAEQDLKAGRYLQAERNISLAAEADPKNWKLWSNLGALRLHLGANDSAVRAFERARRAAPQEPGPCFGEGIAYLKKGDSENAMAAYREGLARDPNDQAANQNYAFLLTQRGQYRDAIDPLKRLKGLRPEDVPTRAALIEAYLNTGMNDEARDEIDLLLGSHIATMQDDLSLARRLVEIHQGNAAIHILRLAVANWPDSPQPHGDLGLLFTKSGQYEASVSELGRAAQLDSKSPEYSLGLGEALLRWRHDSVALQYLLTVQPTFENIPLYKFELGLAHYYLTQFPQALKEFQSLAQEQPKSSQVQYLLGGTYQALGDLDKAEESYRQAIALKPDEAVYYQVLAALLRRSHPADLVEPVKLSEKALALSPNYEDAELLLASCYQTQGNLGEAQRLLEAVVTRDPDSRAAHVALAQVYFRQKRVEDAQKHETIAATLEERKQSEISPWAAGSAAKP